MLPQMCEQHWGPFLPTIINNFESRTSIIQFFPKITFILTFVFINHLALYYSSEKKNQPLFTIYYLFTTGLVVVEIRNKSLRFPVKWVLISCFPNSVPWREWTVMSNAHIFFLTTLVSFVRYHVLPLVDFECPIFEMPSGWHSDPWRPI